ncbi:MAG: isocitrate lyase/phosphoenolpyruvate mutase family protein, partial [Pseudomonadota bacterium]
MSAVTQLHIAKARSFAALHVPGAPLVLYNIWDAGSAQAVEKAGATALATGSASVAGAQGFGDGEQIPLDDVLTVLSRITAQTELPVTLDFEGGYTTDNDRLARNTRAVIEAGAVGVNFEDQVVGTDQLHPISAQAERIAAMRTAAERIGLPLFINARTDLFLKADPATHTGALVDKALARANAYAEAGASGFFAPRLLDEDLIRTLCDA